MKASEYFSDTAQIRKDLVQCLDEGESVERFAEALVPEAADGGVKLSYKSCLEFALTQLDELPSRPIALRVRREKLRVIDEKAAEAGESRNTYLVRRGTEDDSGLALAIRKTLKEYE